jgi:hypothetical protein
MKTNLHRRVLLAKATVFVGLATMVAVALGAASTVQAAPGDRFILGRLNQSFQDISRLVGSPAGPVLRINNTNLSAGATALDLKVGDPNANPLSKSTPPMTVNSSAKVTNLNADQIDGKDSTELIPKATYTKESSSTGTDLGSNKRLWETFCDGGDKVLSGGVFGVDPTGTTLTASLPEDFHQGWYVEWTSTDGTADTITVLVYCADYGTLHTPEGPICR